MSFIVHVDMNNGCLLSECVQVPKFIAHRGLVFLSFWDDNLGVYISIIPLFLSFWDDNLGVYISIIPYHFCEDIVCGAKLLPVAKSDLQNYLCFQMTRLIQKRGTPQSTTLGRHGRVFLAVWLRTVLPVVQVVPFSKLKLYFSKWMKS